MVIQCLSVDQLYKGQLAELPTILDSFTPVSQMITNDHIGVGGGEWWGATKWQVFPCVEVEHY